MDRSKRLDLAQMRPRSDELPIGNFAAERSPISCELVDRSRRIRTLELVGFIAGQIVEFADPGLPAMLERQIGKYGPRPAAAEACVERALIMEQPAGEDEVDLEGDRAAIDLGEPQLQLAALAERCEGMAQNLRPVPCCRRVEARRPFHDSRSIAATASSRAIASAPLRRVAVPPSLKKRRLRLRISRNQLGPCL